MDLFTRPDKVEAAMQAIMAEKREQTRQMVRAIGPFGYWVGSWRTAPQFLSPKLWDRFVWPYMKELVEIVAEEGGIPMLHYDACWDREIERLLELPARTSVLATDGATDIFRAKIINVAPESVIVELTGDEGKIGGFLTLIEPFGVPEIARTGKLAMRR